MDAVTVVERQVEAYNVRDADAFASWYAEDARIADAGDDVVMEGRDAVRAAYARFFSRSPELHVEVLNRLAFGDVVCDLERVTGAPDLAPGEASEGIVVYVVTDGLIRRVWLFV
jgi:uncharacterized protein (TIGR02246 family)